MEKREKVIFGLKSGLAFLFIFSILNMNPISDLNLWMRMAIGALIGLIVSDLTDKIVNLLASHESDRSAHTR